MIRKFGILLLCLVNLTLWGQGEDDDIVFYEDSDVKHSRIMLALNLDPNFTDRRLINSELPINGDIILRNAKAKGSFQLNYGIDFFYRVGSALSVGVGAGMANSNFTVEDAQYVQPSGDTIGVDVESKISMYTLPIKLNFATALNDLFDLEIVPQVQMNFVNSYENHFIPTAGGATEVVDNSDITKNVGYAVGIGLGGTYKFADNWGFFVRGEVKYTITPLIEQSGYPRETLLLSGLNLGLRYSF